MKLRGEVVSGAGQMAGAMTSGPRAHFWATYFGKLVPGTFNVRLPEPFAVHSEVRLPRTADGEAILLQRCQAENLDAFIVRTASEQAAGGRHGLEVIELVSAFPLRRHLRLEDGAEVQITVASPRAEPSNSKGRQ